MTDNVDVTKLLRSLMAYLRGEPKVWSVVRVPTVAEEDDRRLHRERDRLINERVQHVNRIKGIFLPADEGGQAARVQRLEAASTALARSASQARTGPALP